MDYPHPSEVQKGRWWYRSQVFVTEGSQKNVLGRVSVLRIFDVPGNLLPMAAHQITPKFRGINNKHYDLSISVGQKSECGFARPSDPRSLAGWVKVLLGVMVISGFISSWLGEDPLLSRLTWLLTSSDYCWLLARVAVLTTRTSPCGSCHPPETAREGMWHGSHSLFVT